MANEQAASSPPENESYDAGMMADVRAAFDEASKPAETPAEKPAEIAEKPAEPEAPIEPKADHPTDPTRYADGKFKPVKGEEAEKPADPAPKPVEAPAAAQPTSDVQAVAPIQGNPPPGWSVKSKSEWDKLPEHIRADIIKREKETNDGFAQYSGMKELLPYAQRAQSQGQSLKQVLDSFIGMEDLLRQSPQQGFLHIAQRLGYSPQQLAQIFAPYAQSNGQPAQGHQQPADGGYYQQPSFDPALVQQWLNPVVQEVNQIKSLFQQQQESAVNAVIQRFTADPAHRFYSNVEERMSQLFAGGVVKRTGDHWTDLKNAYETACRLDPEISELLLNERIAKSDEARRKTEQEAAEKARHASRSITGSPAAGAPTGADKDDSIEADVRRAYRAHAA